MAKSRKGQRTMRRMAVNSAAQILSCIKTNTKIRYFLNKERPRVISQGFDLCPTNSPGKISSRSVFPFPLLFRRLSSVFFIDSETNETIPLHFRDVFHFFSEKNSSSKTFLVECVRSGAASCNKRREFWRETHTPLWHLIGRIIFFTCENHSSLL